MDEPRLPSPSEAVDVFTSLASDSGHEVARLTATSAWEVFIRFAAVPFQIPDVDDADGLLYGFGSHSFTGAQRFQLDLVRQFAVPDEDEYLQFDCEMTFALDSALTALGSYDQWWWFPADDQELDLWAAAISGRPEWHELARRQPLAVELSIDGT
jgi:hypothetical protein